MSEAGRLQVGDVGMTTRLLPEHDDIVRHEVVQLRQNNVKVIQFGYYAWWTIREFLATMVAIDRPQPDGTMKQVWPEVENA